MVTENFQIRQQALDTLKGQWGSAMVAAIICGAISFFPQVIPGVTYLSFLITLPITYGLMVWFLNFLRSSGGSTPEYVTLFDGFHDYARVVITMFLVGLYTALWSLLLIVPGIVKGISYSMTAYILKDYPELKENKAIELSMAMMEGNKMKLFLMQLNFLVWVLLSIATFGIGFLWALPYMQTTMAIFYEDVKREYESRHIAAAPDVQVKRIHLTPRS